jgi:hypothetical protein
MEIVLILSNLLVLVIFILRFSHLPPQIPLFYSKLWGEDQLADTWMIVFIPILINAFYFLNIYIYRRFFSQIVIVKKIIDFVNIFLMVVLTLIFIKIVFLIS